MEDEVVYSIRTMDDQIVIFDEEVQRNGEELTEFYFTIKEYAEALLDYMKVDCPSTQFKLVELNLKDINYIKGFTAEDIHQKALEEREVRRA